MKGISLTLGLRLMILFTSLGACLHPNQKGAGILYNCTPLIGELGYRSLNRPVTTCAQAYWEDSTD